MKKTTLSYWTSDAIHALLNFTRKRIGGLMVFVSLFAVVFDGVSTPITSDQAKIAAQEFISRRYPAPDKASARSVGINGSSKLGVRQIEELESDGKNIGYVSHLEPAGYVLLRADDQVPAVKIYSEGGNFTNLPPEFLNVIKAELAGELDAVNNPNAKKLRATPRSDWGILMGKTNMEAMASGAASSPGVALIQTAWNQTDPYNFYSPTATSSGTAYGGRAPNGCVALAMAQVLRYHRKPQRVLEDYSYYDGDGNCTGYHSMSDSGLNDYSWDSMPLSLKSSSSLAQKKAVAQLIYHCGVSVDMDFESGGSGANAADVPNALSTFFGFSSSDVVDRADYYNSDWYGAVADDINAGKPVLYYFCYYDYAKRDYFGHAVVCDGYRNGNEIHLNLGWGGSDTAWYNMDNINTSEGAYNYYHQAIFGITPPANSTRPTVSAFSVSPESITLGQSFTINYTVSDNGGPGLQSVQLCRATVDGSATDTSWTAIGKSVPLSGSGPTSGKLSDSPASAGSYWYTVLVLDTANNGAAPDSKGVTVSQAQTVDPTITSFSVSPETVSLGQSVTVNFTVADVGGPGLSQVLLWRINSAGDWDWEVVGDPVLVSGNGPSSGSFSDKPSEAGSYVYELEVDDVSDGIAFSDDIEVTVTDAPATVTLTVKASPTNGGVVNGGGPFDIGSSQAITATANLGWQFKQWQDGNKSNPRTITLPSSNVTYTATFAAIAPAITTTSLPNGTIGSAYSATLQAAGGAPSYAWTITFGSLPPGLYLNSANASITGTPTTAGVCRFTVRCTDANSLFSEKNLSITVAQAPVNSVTVSAVASPGAGGTVSVNGGGTVNSGASVTVSASANPGYTFINWSENDLPVCGSPSYTFTANSNRALVAKFAFVNPVTNSLALDLYAGVIITGKSGQVWQLEWSEEVAGGQWTPAASVVLTNATQVWVDSSAPARAAKRFYRGLLLQESRAPGN